MWVERHSGVVVDVHEPAGRWVRRRYALDETGVWVRGGAVLPSLPAGGEVLPLPVFPYGELKYRGARRVRTQVHCISVPFVIIKILLLNYIILNVLLKLKAKVAD